VVSPSYFEVLGTPVLAGRAFAPSDDAGGPLVALVSAYTANKYWPGESALGKCIIVDRRDAPCRTVVGIVKDQHSLKVREPATMHYYLPLAQVSDRPPRSILVRVVPGARERVRTLANRLISGELGRGLHWRMQNYTDLLGPELRPWRLSATLFSSLGILALLVAGVGVYGTVSFHVGQRTHEIGVRRALGAGDASVVALILAETMVLICLAAALGTLGALLFARAARAGLYGVSLVDPISLLGAVLTLVITAAFACIIPARRATRISPTLALNAD